jgi:amphi-Trp domain-containing protein
MAHKVVRQHSKDQRSREQVADALRTLADRIASDELTVGHGDGEARIHVPETIRYGVKVQEKNKSSTRRHMIKITLQWSEDAPASTSQH